MIETFVLILFGGLAALALVLFLLTFIVTRRIEGTIRPLGQAVEVDGATIRYIDVGTGPAILLIHGLGGQLRHMTYALVDLLKGEFRVVALDRPGYGYSTKTPGASPRLSAQAAVIARFMDAIRLEKPLVVGHSLGGALALALAIQHRDHVAGLALVAPLSHPTVIVPEPFKPLATESPLRRWLLAHLLATPGAMIGGKATVALVFGPDPVPDDFATRGGDLLAIRPGSVIAASSEMVATRDDLTDMAARYPGLDAPVGVLYGTRDQILDPTYHGTQLAERIPGATIDYVEGAGHMLPQVHAARTADFVRAMAARVYAGASGAGSRK